jgi:HK97 family phage portal protein
MPVVQSIGSLTDLQPGWWPVANYGSLRLYDQYSYDYATMYRTQPNVRTCVDFLARNIAQLGLHVFRRVSDTDRVRLTDHPLAVVLGQPLPAEFKVTYYRLVEALVSDLGVYFNAYWLKVRSEGTPAGLLRIPPPYVVIGGGLVPTGYKITVGGKIIAVAPEGIVHFRGYNPENPISGLSPLETLRRILAEEAAAGDYREHFWRNAARMGGVIERPPNAPEWSEPARARFKQEFEALYSGTEASGKTAILEEGMTWRPGSFNPQESEYLAGRKLTREECARAYHIPLPMVGILDNATFSNIREQHKNLYQDSLGPWLAMIEQDIMLQLLPEFGDTEGVYCEFNIAEKLAGAFDEQVTALQAAVGRPWMTANEARARLNLPALSGDANALVTPLNVLVGAQASPRDTAPPKALEAGSQLLPQKSARALDSHLPELRERHQEKWVATLTRHYKRQEAAVMSRLPEAQVVGDGKGDLGGVWWDEERWDRELGEDLLRLNVLTAGAWAGEFAGRLGAEISEDRMLPWLQEHSRLQATYINRQTRDQLQEALRDPEPREAVKDLFLTAISVWALREAISAITTAANFGANEAAQAGGLTRKTWRVNSSNPRAAHLAMDGETVGIRDRFSNGMRWPGDPAGGAENNANCQCSVEFGR